MVTMVYRMGLKEICGWQQCPNLIRNAYAIYAQTTDEFYVE